MFVEVMVNFGISLTVIMIVWALLSKIFIVKAPDTYFALLGLGVIITVIVDVVAFLVWLWS